MGNYVQKGERRGRGKRERRGFAGEKRKRGRGSSGRPHRLTLVAKSVTVLSKFASAHVTRGHGVAARRLRWLGAAIVGLLVGVGWRVCACVSA
jgi:hypothetical protein